MANVVTGRESLASILAIFDKTAKRLDTFIAQQQADREKASEKVNAAIADRETATANIEQATRTRAKIAELIG
jgi:hypothetical protein